MASYKTAHRRQHRRRSSTRKNVKSRKVTRGGGNPQTRNCNASRPKNTNDAYSSDMMAWRKQFELDPNVNVNVACQRKYGN